MTTRPVKSLIDEQLEELEPITLLLAPGEDLAQRLGLPRETRLIDTPICSAMTIKSGRRYLKVRHVQ